MLPLHHSAGGTPGLYTVTGRTFVVQLASHSTNTGGCFVMPSKIKNMLQSNNFYCCCSGEGSFKVLFSFGFFGFSLWSFCWCHCWYFSDGGGNVLFIMLLTIKIYNLLVLEISLIHMAIFSAYRHGGVCEELSFKQKSRVCFSYKHHKFQLVKRNSVDRSLALEQVCIFNTLLHLEEAEKSICKIRKLLPMQQTSMHNEANQELLTTRCFGLVLRGQSF